MTLNITLIVANIQKQVIQAEFATFYVSLGAVKY